MKTKRNKRAPGFWAHLLKEDSQERLSSVEKLETRSFRTGYLVLSVILACVMIGTLLVCVSYLPRYGGQSNPTSNEVAQRYIESGMQETGAVNLVAGMILDYRAFDTLGESFVLFTATCSVLILMREDKDDTLLVKDARDEAWCRLIDDPIARLPVSFLVPIILLFGVYVLLNGHLGPGGGFSGGAIIGAGLIMHAQVFGFENTSRFISLRVVRTVTGLALSFYALSKSYSFFTGANGLHSIISAGTPGRIISAGLIMPLNVAVGMVVACTMYSFYAVFRRGRI